MSVNDFIDKDTDNIVINYNDNYYSFNKNIIKKSHIRKCIIHKHTLKKENYFYIGLIVGKKIVVNFKTFNKFITDGNRILKLSNIISSGDKYIHKYCYYDALKLYHSPFYDYMNNGFLLNNKINLKIILEYFGIENITDDESVELVNREIKKLDKVFIHNSYENKALNKTFYCNFRSINKCIRNFTLLTTNLKHNAYKIILEEGLPYIVINETDILLPRNILFEVVLNEEYTLLAKSTIKNQFIQKYTLTADLYDINVSYSENKIIGNEQRIIYGGTTIDEKFFRQDGLLDIREFRTNNDKTAKNAISILDKFILNKITEPVETINGLLKLQRQLQRQNNFSTVHVPQNSYYEQYILPVFMSEKYVFPEFVYKKDLKKKKFIL